jgi:hypothetical protein
MQHKAKLQDIEDFIAQRKKDYLRDIRHYRSTSQDEVNLIYLQMAESGLLFVEELGKTFFNWE